MKFAFAALVLACVAGDAAAQVDHAAHHGADAGAAAVPDERPVATPEVLAPGERPSEQEVRSADARAAEAIAGIDRALEELRRGTGDTAALDEVRARLAELEEALSIRASKDAPAPDGAVPLRWFRARTGADHPSSPRPVSLVHVIGMVGLAALVGLAAIHAVRRRRRARAVIAAARAEPPAHVTLTAPSGGWTGRLRIARIFIETPTTRTFRLVGLDGGPIPFRFRAGQYVRVTVELEGRPHTRAYSLSSDPGQHSYIELTIKREPDGKVSRFLHDVATAGDTLGVSGPAGQFTFDDGARDRVLLIGGGVGLTPLMSTIRDLTARAWPGQIVLIASVARSDERLFGDELDLLARRHPHLRIVTVVAPPDDPSTWIDAAFLTRTVTEIERWRVHLCGPPGMMTGVSGYLRTLGVPAHQIWTEAFSTVRSAPAEAGGAAHEVRFAASARTAVVSGSATILDAAEQADVAIDASCRVGICGACKVRLIRGRATMAVDEALTDEDRANGVVLACQAVPQGDVEVGA